MFRAHVLIIRRSKLHYTASGIITHIGDRLVHRLRAVHETVTYWCDYTRRCVMQFWPPGDEHMCSKHAEAWNKLIVKQKFCTSSWLITETNICKLLFGVSCQFAEGREFLMTVNVVFLAYSRLCRNQLTDGFYVTNICKLLFILSTQHSECKVLRQNSSVIKGNILILLWESAEHIIAFLLMFKWLLQNVNTWALTLLLSAFCAHSLSKYDRMTLIKNIAYFLMAISNLPSEQNCVLFELF